MMADKGYHDGYNEFDELQAACRQLVRDIGACLLPIVQAIARLLDKGTIPWYTGGDDDK